MSTPKIATIRESVSFVNDVRNRNTVQGIMVTTIRINSLKTDHNDFEGMNLKEHAPALSVVNPIMKYTMTENTEQSKMVRGISTSAITHAYAVAPYSPASRCLNHTPRLSIANPSCELLADAMKFTHM